MNIISHLTKLLALEITLFERNLCYDTIVFHLHVNKVSELFQVEMTVFVFVSQMEVLVSILFSFFFHVCITLTLHLIFTDTSVPLSRVLSSFDHKHVHENRIAGAHLVDFVVESELCLYHSGGSANHHVFDLIDCLVLLHLLDPPTNGGERLVNFIFGSDNVAVSGFTE